MQTLQKPTLFWDIDPASLDEEQNKHYIIERIMQRGDMDDIRWMRKRYDEEVLVEVVKKSRQLNPKSLNFWCVVLGIDTEVCTKKLSERTQSPFWKR